MSSNLQRFFGFTTVLMIVAALFNPYDPDDYAAVCKLCRWEGDDESQAEANQRAIEHTFAFGHGCYVIASSVE